MMYAAAIIDIDPNHDYFVSQFQALQTNWTSNQMVLTTM